LFFVINEDKPNFNKDNPWLKSVMLFYAKTTAWVVLPLAIGLVAGKFTQSQTLFFLFLMIGFGITCYGIYKEIKQYKKQLEESEKNGNK
jgi:F0F1-type ATP synthase assembly protein I